VGAGPARPTMKGKKTPHRKSFQFLIENIEAGTICKSGQAVNPF